MLRFLLLTCLLISAGAVQAQDKLNVKFGKITPENFNVSAPVIDSGTNAVVLFDIGSSEFEGNNKGWFTLVFRRHIRIKVLNDKGMDAATFGIRLFRSTNNEESLQDVRGATYNLENGSVIATKLESKNIFSEETNKHLVTKKFTLPAVKAGSIIEYAYTIKSDFFTHLQSWEFQGEYPRLWSEYEVNIPEYFNYVFLSQGYLSYNVNSRDQFQRNFQLSFSSGGEASQHVNLNGAVNTNRWVIKNAPSLKTEPFTTTIRNHIAKMEFQLAEIRLPNRIAQPVMASWKKIGEEMLKSNDFGLPISRSNGWLDDEMAMITKGAANKTESAKKIFAYVRDNFTSKGPGIALSDLHSLKDIFKNKNGSEGELNLMLVAMLRHEKIQAWPVMLSTRQMGVAHPIYPLMDRYNYLVCLAAIDSVDYLMDASVPRIGFGKLPEYCYNGTARMITEDPEAIDLSADRLVENKMTTVIIGNVDGKIEGTVSSQLGYYASLDLRNKLAKSGESEIHRELARKYPTEIKTQNFSIDSLKSYDDPVTIHYELAVNFNQEDLLYVNPMFADAVKENLFKSAKRYYPVEMPYMVNDTYLLTMEIPEGYVVDELPRSVRAKLNEDGGMFEYIIANSNNMIQMRCRVVLNKANFATDDYESLRNFYSLIVKKESEQIVFKKKK